MATGLLYLDAFSGVAGDMLCAALLDAGAPVDRVDAVLRALPIEARVTHAPVERGGIRARRFLVEAPEETRERTWSTIDAMLREAPLAPAVRDRARATFARLAEAEGEVHGVPAADVHFHEVGAIDSIVDVVVACALLDALDVEVVCAPLPMGSGFTGSRHGRIPLPAPATLACLRGVPTYDAGIEGELVTPTGAALVVEASARFGRWPAMRPSHVGHGAGARELADRPNVLRAVRGHAVVEGATLVRLETNLDDATPELVAHALERLREEGARDAWVSPITMKKGRAAVMVSALAERGAEARLARVLLAETPSLGVRMDEVGRVERPRRTVEVATPYGAIAVKIADGDGLPRHLKPEHDACAAAARAHGVTLREVIAAALTAAGTR